MFKRIALLALLVPVLAFGQAWRDPGVKANNPTWTGVMTAPSGAAGAPSYTFLSDTTAGCYLPAQFQLTCGTSVGVASPGNNTTMELGAAAAATGNTHLLNLKAGAAGAIGSVNFYTSGSNRWLINTSGTLAAQTLVSDQPTINAAANGTVSGSGTTVLYQLGGTWNTTGVVPGMLTVNVVNTGSGAGSRLLELQRGGAIQFGVTSGANTTGTQIRTAQATVPTITTNGGTSPVCVGTDTFMTCTEGTSPPVAATFTVTFNGTWAAAPPCIAIRGTAGASPLVQSVVTTTTTAQVNLSANLVASEAYHIHCGGRQ